MGRWGRNAALAVLGWALAAAAIAAPQHLQAIKADALNHFYNLEYPQAIAEFRQVAAARPHAAGAWNHLAQALLYQEMYRMGALESTLYGKSDAFLQRKLKQPDPAEVAAILNAIGKAMNAAQAAVGKDANDAQAHYDLAVAWGLRANLAFSVKKSYWDALGYAKNARREAEIAHRLRPQWPDPLLIIGVQNYVAGSLPLTVKIFTSLVGYRGNKKLGIEQITHVAEHGGHAQTDAQVLLAVLDRREGWNQNAAKLLAGLAQRYPRNVLFAVESGEAWEAAGEHGKARTALQGVLARAQAGAPGYEHAPRAQVWYDLGAIAALYSQWKLAEQDYKHAAAVPNAPPLYRAAAKKAATIAAQKADGGE
ncbi:MAG: hypothetical protein ACRD04_13460 [Terriglobales bacterium]